MNKSSEFEQIIKEKLNSFEYPYNNSSWKKFKNDIPGKNPFWGSAALISVVSIITIAIVWYFNTNEINNVICKNNQKVILNNNETETPDNNIVISNNKSQKVHKKEFIVKNVLSNNNTDEINNVQHNNFTINNVVPPFKSEIKKQVAPVASFVCDIYEGCQPLSVKFTPSEISDTIIYSWDFGDGIISTERTPSHTYLKSGNYSVLLMVKYFKSEPVISNLKQNVINVNELPVSNFVYQINGYSVNLVNQSENYQKNKWLFNDSTSTDENCSKNYYLNGKYIVKLVTTNNAGCSDTSSKVLEIKIKHPIFVASAFKPLTDGINSKIGPQILNEEDYYFEYEVFNKTGQNIYQAKGNNVDWDGKNKYTQQIADEDFYFYKLKVVDKYGNVDVIRGKFKLLK